MPGGLFRDCPFFLLLPLALLSPRISKGDKRPVNKQLSCRGVLVCATGEVESRAWLRGGGAIRSKRLRRFQTHDCNTFSIHPGTESFSFHPRREKSFQQKPPGTGVPLQRCIGSCGAAWGLRWVMSCTTRGLPVTARPPPPC